MKTTPGPWIARHNGHFWEVGTSLAEFAHSVAHVPQSAFMPGDAEANARLLASATDLLAALQMAVRQNSHDMQLTGEELRLCEAAIAKATGGAA